MDPNFDVKAHASWFARELRREPNPRRLFEEVFNDRAIGEIPRNRAHAMLCFYLSAKEASEFPNQRYPSVITRRAESLLRELERVHGLQFARDCPAWPAKLGDERLADVVENERKVSESTVAGASEIRGGRESRHPSVGDAIVRISGVEDILARGGDAGFHSHEHAQHHGVV